MTAQEITSKIEMLKQQLLTKYHPDKIIFFGSAAHGDAVINDVDFFIVKDDVPALGAERIRQLYRMMDTDLPVDYLVYRPSEVAQRLALGEKMASFHQGFWLTLKPAG
jgi:predicted nucleotidyltransferase